MKRGILLKIASLFVWNCLLISCKPSYDAPKLPDLNKKTFSYDDVVNKKKDLQKRMQKKNKEEDSYGSKQLPKKR